MLFSKSTDGFYATEIHGDNIPSDAISITDEEYAALMQAQSEGKQITTDESGRPIAIDPPPPAPFTREEIEALRLRAYSDPLTGSDRHFAEAASMEVAGESGADECRAAGLARRAEIQAMYPWPK